MKRLLIAITLILCLCVPAWAVNYVELGRNDDQLWSLDLDSVSDRGDHLVVWVKIIPRGREVVRLKKVYKESVSRVMQMMAINKKLPQIQVLAVIYYSNNGSSIKSYNFRFAEHEYMEVVPDTFGDDLYNIITVYHNLKSQQQ